MADIPAGYGIRQGTKNDRSFLLHSLTRTHRELFPAYRNLSHLEDTVRQHFSTESPFWIVEKNGESIGCLWGGTAIDQVTGSRYLHVFLVYVAPDDRNRGLATALLSKARELAKARGYPQIGLQVFTNNQQALSLYQKLDFQPRSLLMLKQI